MLSLQVIRESVFDFVGFLTRVAKKPFFVRKAIKKSFLPLTLVLNLKEEFKLCRCL